MVLNKGFTNTVAKKAVPCDLVAELFKLRDYLLEHDEDYADMYDIYEDDFENWNQDDYQLGNCVISMIQDNGIVADTSIYSSEYYLNTNGKYQGICKLPNGADIIVFDCCCEEQPSGMYTVLYFDGEKLRLFTPYEGNAVNIALNTCLLDEEYVVKPKINNEYVSQIYPNGLNLDWVNVKWSNLKDEEFDAYYDMCEQAKEDARKGYAEFLGMKFSDFKDGNFDLDVDAICNEIENVLG